MVVPQAPGPGGEPEEELFDDELLDEEVLDDEVVVVPELLDVEEDEELVVVVPELLVPPMQPAAMPELAHVPKPQSSGVS
jgi:hypothetical protein